MTENWAKTRTIRKAAANWLENSQTTESSETTQETMKRIESGVENRAGNRK